MKPEIEICVIGLGFALEWRTPDGITHRRQFGNRKALIDTMPGVLAEARGPKFPTIDEEITIGVPRRRAGEE